LGFPESVFLSHLHASPQDQSVCDLQNDLVGFGICYGESHAYVVSQFGIAQHWFMGIEMVGISYFNPVRLMWCLPYQSISLMCKMMLAHDLVGLTISNSKAGLGRGCLMCFERRVDVLCNVAVMSSGTSPCCAGEQLCEVKNHLVPSVFIYEFKGNSTKKLGRIRLADDTVLRTDSVLFILLSVSRDLYRLLCIEYVYLAIPLNSVCTAPGLSRSRGIPLLGGRADA
jgi:hypothetical protein